MASVAHNMSVAAAPIPLPATGSPPPPPRAVRALPFFALIGTLGAVVIFSALALWRSDPVPLFWITFGYLFYELGINLLLVLAAASGIRQMRRNMDAVPVSAPLPTLSVLIAAHNERSCILDTLESVLAQKSDLAGLEILVASDGSIDGMNELLTAQYTLDPATGKSPDGRLCLLALPKVGKGPALNAALAAAQGELVVTLDADTRLAPGALRSLALLFARDATVASAGGFVYVRNAGPGGPWIARYQFWEYLKNFMWRIGLAHLGVCLQVSGAFGAFRTTILREELGGFSGRSLVEDYEIIYRLHERLRRAGRAYRVAVAPDAVAFTDGPETVPAFLHQRTRWFTGFLQTLWEYRRLVFGQKMGALGHFMLPLKCVDAVLPLWGALSLGILLAAAFSHRAPPNSPQAWWQRAALGLFLGKWLFDVALSGVMWRWHVRLFPGRAGIPPLRRQAWFIVTEGLIFNWFRQLAVLNAYGWFVRRVQKWHQPRWNVASAAAPLPTPPRDA